MLSQPVLHSQKHALIHAHIKIKTYPAKHSCTQRHPTSKHRTLDKEWSHSKDYTVLLWVPLLCTHTRNITQSSCSKVLNEQLLPRIMSVWKMLRVRLKIKQLLGIGRQCEWGRKKGNSWQQWLVQHFLPCPSSTHGDKDGWDMMKTCQLTDTDDLIRL